MTIFNKDGSKFKTGSSKSETEHILHNFDQEIPHKVVDVVVEKINSPELYNYLTIINCLPVEKVMIKDDLYGENTLKVRYLQPLKLNVAISTSNDLVFECWCQTKLEKDSIIHQMIERRWWIVKEVFEKNDWFKFSCLPSAITPHFN